MDMTQLKTQLAQLGVKPPDELRASLYLNHLVDTKNFFTQTMQQNAPTGVGGKYSFVKAAVTSASLLNELAGILDLYVALTVDRDLQLVFAHDKYTYAQYFDATNLQNFLQRFPITAHALQTITNNFQQNILQACTRIIQDQKAITNLFKDKYEWLTLDGLKAIESSGSDFHKGGKQVLILTFSISYFGYKHPVRDQLKLVYKPSDIEVDCLLVGDSSAVKQADSNFNITASLIEIINGLVKQAKLLNPNSTLEELPTYRILPRNYISQHQQQMGVALPIRNAYGYLEFLQYEADIGPNLGGWNLGVTKLKDWYPFGSSDFLILPDQAEGPIITKFYRQMGQWLALACTFSLKDLHLQNVRVMRYMPHLIDLEVSLVSIINKVDDTELLSHTGNIRLGGINGEYSDSEDYVFEVLDADTNGDALIDRVMLTKYYQNRLYAFRPNKKLVPVNAVGLLEGLTNAMTLIRRGVQNNSFNNWFARLDGVLVRYLAYSTKFVKEIRKGIYERALGSALYNAQPANIIQDILLASLTAEYIDYQNAPTPQPNFIVLQNNIVGPDYTNVDIPVFYHKIGTTNIVDSRGNEITVPATVTISDPNNPPNGTMQVNTNVRSRRFFARAPTTANVERGQVNSLAVGANFKTRVKALQKGTRAYLNALPKDPGVLIPTD